MRVFLALLLLVSISSCTTHYYVVRHAEKTSDVCTAPLASAGFTRAAVLRDTLRSKGIDSVFVSTCLRTQQTAQPLATSIARALLPFAPSEPMTQALVARLNKIKGKSVLVVGHTSTVPAIVLGLSGRTISPIADSDFDNLYIVKRKTFLGTTRTLQHVTYGTPTN